MPCSFSAALLRNRINYMIKDWLIGILRVPDTGEPLAYDGGTQHLSGGGENFSAEDGVPSFVKEAPSPSGFDYTKHYAIDAEAFDYFRERTDKLTATHLRLLRTTVLKQVPKTATLLFDVGYGCAFVAEHCCPDGKKVVSMDIARTNTQKALAKFPFDNHAAVVADAYHLPFADQTFEHFIITVRKR